MLTRRRFVNELSLNFMWWGATRMLHEWIKSRIIRAQDLWLIIDHCSVAPRVDNSVLIFLFLICCSFIFQVFFFCILDQRRGVTNKQIFKLLRFGLWQDLTSCERLYEWSRVRTKKRHKQAHKYRKYLLCWFLQLF